MFLFRRATTSQPLDTPAVVRCLKADLRETREQCLTLSTRLRSAIRRADVAEEALGEMHLAQREGHAAMVEEIARLRRENELLRRDRESALEQLDHALGYDDKMLAIINAGGVSKAAAA
ncbi:hypothetical protein ACH4E7_07025 [Kitasatospora sp. NPDC018058]|uniref:hypothetical protein n=1 Tax=Kitasatospora sp. NPDC018058 TaxID=3364025 RepID=UPI0037BF416E